MEVENEMYRHSMVSLRGLHDEIASVNPAAKNCVARTLYTLLDMAAKAVGTCFYEQSWRDDP